MTFKHKLLYGVIGFLLGNSLLLVLYFAPVYIFKQKPAEITLEKSIELIGSGTVKDVVFSAERAKLTTKEGRESLVFIPSDPVREILVNEVVNANRENPLSRITLSEESNSLSFTTWMIFLNGIPVLIGLGIILLLTAILVVLVRKRPFT